MGHCIHNSCSIHKYIFPPCTCLWYMLSSGKGSLTYLHLHPDSHDSARAKARWCRCSYSGDSRNQYYRHRQPSRLTEVIYPPRLDWVANYTVTGQDIYARVDVDLTLYRTTHWTSWQHGGRLALSHQHGCSQCSQWLRMATKKWRSNDFHFLFGQILV